MGLSKKSNFLLDRAPQKSVNASRPALRLAAHDSGSGWLATPSLCDSFIHYSIPIFTGAPTRHAGPHTAVQRVEPSRAGGSRRRSPQGLRRSAGFRFGFTDAVGLKSGSCPSARIFA